VGGTIFSLKRKGLKGVKTTGTRNSLKAGTRAQSCKEEVITIGLMGLIMKNV
jgi:hypothetical protein